MKDTKFKDWQAFLDHQAKRGLSQKVIELVKAIRLQVTRQFKLDAQQINLQNAKITFHLLSANQRGKVFLNIHLREDLLRLLLINDGGSIPTIAEKIKGVKDYPNLHKIELKQRNDFNTDVILAIMDSFKAATNLAAAPPKPKVNGVPPKHINEKALNRTTKKPTPSKE